MLELIAYDFDGVMTDNRVMLSENGMESVIVNRGDGQGIGMIKSLGIDQIIVSTETNFVVTQRARKLKIPAIQAVNNKRETLEAYCKEKGYNLKNVAFVGNDINDLEAMQIVGKKICPNDAEVEIREIADLVLTKNGGFGVIRELARLIVEEEM